MILDTDIPDFALTSISGLKAPVDDTTAQVWFQINSQLSVPAGSVAFTLAADKAEHYVVIPAGTVLGDYVLENDFAFYTHSNGYVDTNAPVINITGFKAYNYRDNNSDWYIVLETDNASFSMADVLNHLMVTNYAWLHFDKVKSYDYYEDCEVTRLSDDGLNYIHENDKLSVEMDRIGFEW